MCQGATPPNVTLTGPFRHLIGTSLFGAMAHFVYCVTLKESLEQAVDYTKGDKSRCRTVVRETPIPAYKADDVARTRKELKLSQRGLATALGVSPRTVESWEAGKNAPSGAAQRLLYLFECAKVLLHPMLL